MRESDPDIVEFNCDNPVIERVIEALDLKNNDVLTTFQTLMAIQVFVMSQLDPTGRKELAKSLKKTVPYMLADANRLAAENAAEAH